MKNLLIKIGFVLLISFCSFVAICSFIGHENYREAKKEIKQSEGTDGDIESILKKHGFDLKWYETPNGIDFIKSAFSNQ